MAKEIFSNGECVKAKKWGGSEFLGMYEYAYTDGSHCVLDVRNGKRYNVLKGEIEKASEEEEKEIKKLFKDGDFELRTTSNEKVGTIPHKTETTTTTNSEKDEDLEALLEAVEDEESILDEIED